MENVETVAQAAPIEGPALIVYGKDEAGRPHASTFVASEVETALRAAGLMQMKALHVWSDDHREVAKELPVGRIFSSGKAFLPFVGKAIYDRLKAMPGAIEPPPPMINDGPADPLPPVTGVPSTWGDIVVGSLVLASEGDGEGWYEAIVRSVKGDDLFELRWRDWPDEPTCVRQRDDLALLSVRGSGFDAERTE